MKKIILFFSLSLSLFATTYSFSVGEVTKIYPQIDDEFHTVLRIEGFSSSSGVVMEPRKYYGKYYGYNDKEWILYGITSSGEKGQVVVTKSTVDTTSKHCPDDLVYDDNGLCVSPLPPECTDDEYLDDNNQCQPLVVPDPENFPTTDDNASSGSGASSSSSGGGSNGSTSVTNLPTTQDNCIPGTTFTSSMGVYQIIGWDNATNKCKTAIFRCNSGYVYDESTKSCKLPPDEIDTTNDGSNTADAACPGGKFAQRWTYNFCDQCRGDFGVWLPPVGLEGYGLECNRKYIEYDCIKDYRIKKFVEVSCGNVPPPEDPVTHEIDMDELTDSDVKDTNVSNLPAIDPTKANTELNSRLDLINDSIAKKLFPEAQKTNDHLATIEMKIDGATVEIQRTNQKLDSVNNNLSTIQMKIDGTTAEITKVSDAINSIKNDDGSGFDVNTLQGSDFGIDDSAMTDDSGFLDSLEDNVKFITDEVTGIKDDFDNTLNLIKGTPVAVSIPSGSCSNENLRKFAGYIAPYSSIFSLITYISTMLLILKMVFTYLSRGENS